MAEQVEKKKMEPYMMALILGISISFSVGIILAISGFMVTNPYSKSSAFIKFALYSVPLSFLLLLTLKNRIQEIVPDPKKAKVILFQIFGALFTVVFASVSYLNSMLDTSEASEYKVDITSKYETRNNSKSGVRYSYYIQFESPIDATCCFISGDYESLRISRKEFDAVVVGKTKLEFKLKKGFINVPWIVKSDLIGLSTDSNTNNPEAQNAVSWQAETINNETSEFRIEKWNEHQDKSKEPLLNGQPHGLATYWHPNGKIYGEIPYKNGQKHGKFKLFREDGTLDQELSYKDGVLHGVCKWYDEKGNLKQEVLYVNGQITELPK